MIRARPYPVRAVRPPGGRRAWWGVAALVLAAGLGFFLLRAGTPAGSLPQRIDLEKSDFMVFGGNYAFQVREGFRPRVDVAAVRLTHPVDWNMDPFHDRNWRYQLSAWRMLNPIWSRWYGRDERRLVAEVMPWVHDWYVYHVLLKRPSDFQWYDMATGYRAQHLALLLHLREQGQIALSPEQLAEVRTLARLHIRKLRDPRFITHGNHGIFQVHGLRLLCLSWPDEACRGEEAYSSKLMANLLHSQFGAHGVHTENSPAYHLFALATFSGLRPALYPSIERDFQRTLAEARAVAPWFTLPDGKVAPMGDSAGAGAPLPKNGRPSCSSQDHAGNCIIGKDLISAGYAIVRTAPGVPRAQESMLIVGGSSMAPKSHDHADELGFVLYDAGRALLVDAGKYSYNSDRWRRYFTSDRAHNVVGLEGVTFGPSDTVTDGSALLGMSERGNTYTIDGMVERAGGFRHRRRFVYRPGRSLTVTDHVVTKQRAVAYWHLAPGVKAKPSPAGVDLLVQGAVVGRLVLRKGDCRPEVVTGQGGARIQGWVSPSYLRRVPAAVVEYHCAAGVQDIETEVTFGERAAAELPESSPR